MVLSILITNGRYSNKKSHSLADGIATKIGKKNVSNVDSETQHQATPNTLTHTHTRRTPDNVIKLNTN